MSTVPPCFVALTCTFPSHGLPIHHLPNFSTTSGYQTRIALSQYLFSSGYRTQRVVLPPYLDCSPQIFPFLQFKNSCLVRYTKRRYFTLSLAQYAILGAVFPPKIGSFLKFIKNAKDRASQNLNSRFSIPPKLKRPLLSPC